MQFLKLNGLIQGQMNANAEETRVVTSRAIKMERVALKVKKRGTFPKGYRGPGRKAGIPNKMTTLLKDAIITAAELVGEDGKGKGQLIGYLKDLAVNEKKAYASLLARVLPYHIVAHNHNTTEVVHTVEQLEEALRARGLPVAPMVSSGFVPGDNAKLVGSNKKKDRGDE
jgi:hypothetical protein